MNTLRLMVWSFAVLWAAANAQAGIVVAYVAPSTTPVTPPTSLTPSNVMAGVTATNLTRQGLAPVNGPGFYSQGWSSPTNAWLQWGFTNSSQPVNLSVLQINVDRPNASLPNNIFLWYRSSSQGVFTQFSNSGSLTNSPYVVNFNLSTIANLQNVTSAEFVLSSTNYNGTLGITNNASFFTNAGVVVFEGATSAPEPTGLGAMAVLLLTSAGEAYRRRKRLSKPK